MVKRIIRLLLSFLGLFIFAVFLAYLYSPYGEMFIRSIQTGLIFQSEAYASTVLSSKHNDNMLGNVKMPQGFRIDVFAADVPNARSLARSDKGTIFVGTRTNDKVFALIDSNKDYKVDKKYIVARGLKMPNGVAYKNGSLYVAEVSRLLRFDDIDNHLENPPQPIILYDGFPTDTHHGWKFIAFGPDDALYIPIGAPCNICSEKDPYATITRMKTDFSDYEIIARGVRNTVGFDWHPQTKQLWFTDNGRDWLGDDTPPDELNKASKAGLHFGFPYCHGNDVPDPKFGGKGCSEFQNPELELGPHVAALGMRFYRGDMFPEKYRTSIFIAEHGSWNRTVPIGYRITMVPLKDGKAVSYEVFAEGFRYEGNTWGRPVDLLELPDGSLLVSDDRAGAIYRISYKQ